MSARLYRSKSVQSPEPQRKHGTTAWQEIDGVWTEMIFDGQTNLFLGLDEFRALEKTRAQVRRAQYLRDGGFPRQIRCQMNRRGERYLLRGAPDHLWP